MKHIIKNFKPISGQHCITTSMRHIFLHSGHDISEEMLLGLGSGLSFFYGDFKMMPFPFIGMRERVGVFEESLAKCLQVDIQIHETASAKKAYSALKDLISQDIPVMIYVDMPYLKYLCMPEDAHFGGHSIVVFGIDEEDGMAYVSDRDDKSYKITMSDHEAPADFHTVTLQELEQARGSKCKSFPPKNKWLTFDFTKMKPIESSVITAAIRETSAKMLNPPIKNLGVKGIKLCAQKVLGWRDFDDNKLKGAAFNGYIFISPVGGTGGGGFRKMYGTFLRESGNIIRSDELTVIGDEYVAVGEEWNTVAEQFYHVFETLEREPLQQISEKIGELYEKEAALMNRLQAFCEAVKT